MRDGVEMGRVEDAYVGGGEGGLDEGVYDGERRAPQPCIVQLGDDLVICHHLALHLQAEAL